MTKIIKINSKKPEKQLIKLASETIKSGGLVVFPTETVYGLGASALNRLAVSKIFKAKGRKVDNPLIVHVYNKNDIKKLAKNIPSNVNGLINRFWPGPLTIILEKKPIVPGNVTSGLKTVAIRMPSNKIALELIKLAGPIAAPSANLSGKPSGTMFKHVFEDFNGKIDAIIESVDSKIGLESTVINLTTSPPLLLRPGYITLEQLRKYLPDIEVYKQKSKNEKSASPGMKYKHYSPKAKVIIVKNDKEMKKLENKYKNKKVKIVDIKNPKVLAKNLFKIFRESDEKGYDIVLVKELKEKGLGLAVMNRLRKAASS